MTMNQNDLKFLIEETVEVALEKLLEKYHLVPKSEGDESWFYSETWERWEDEADEEIKSGKMSKVYDSSEDLINDLHKGI